MTEADAGRGTLLPVASGREVAAWAWRALAGRRGRLVGVLALYLAQSGTSLVVPLVVGGIVDTVVLADGDGVPVVFWWQLGLLPLVALVSGVLAWASGQALAGVAETVIAELREAYVEAALDLPRATIEDAGTGDVVTRASDDIAQVSGDLPNVVPEVAGSAFTLVLVALALGGLNPWFFAVFALIAPCYVLAGRWYLRTGPPVYASERAAQSTRGQEVLGTLMNLPTVTAHRLETRQRDRIGATTWQTVRWAMRTTIVQNRLFGRLNAIQALGLLAVLGIGVALASAGAATPGQVTAAALLFLQTVAPIESLLYVTDDLQSAMAALGRLVGVTRTRADRMVTDGSGDRGSGRRGALVELHGVGHAYAGGPPVLHDIDLRIAPGETVALVGATGSGKSTIAALLAGIHDPTSGRIERSVPIRRIVTVTQESHVFSATLRDNLGLVAPDAADADLVAGLGRVGAEGLLDLQPEGLDTPLGDDGYPIGPAQSQHLALARLVLRDAELVILDEATAEADSADADALDRATASVITGRAALVVAHRLSQAAAADRVVVLEAGRIVEEGTHADLVAAGGTYAALWAAWSAPGRDG